MVRARDGETGDGLLQAAQRAPRGLNERYEAANQKVTELLTQVDVNVCMATEAAASLLSDVKTFTAHTKAVHLSLKIWVGFFKAFEEEERKLMLADQNYMPEQSSILSQPSFFASPRTPQLDDSTPRLDDRRIKRQYDSPDQATPDFGLTPPRSVRLKAGSGGPAAGPAASNTVGCLVGAAGTGACAGVAGQGGKSTVDGDESFSPVSQPNFHAGNTVGEGAGDVSQNSNFNVFASPQFLDGEAGVCAGASGGGGGMWKAEESLNDSRTPTISSPTQTITMSALQSLAHSSPGANSQTSASH